MTKNFSIIILLLLLIVSINGQSKHKAFTMVKGDSVAIFLVNPLSASENYNVYRKTDTGYVLLTKEPIVAVLDPTEARVILGSDWEFISKAVNSDNVVQVSRQIRSNTFKGAVLSLISNRAAQISGRWFLDTNAKNGKSHSYKLVFNSLNRVIDSILISTSNKTIIPKAPSNLELTAGNKSIKLVWNYYKWDGDFSDLGFTYNVYRKKGNGKFEKINKNIIIRDDASTPEYEDLWLQEGQKYSYKVTIADPIGNESKPTDIEFVLLKDKTPPSIVTNILAQEEKGKINISWNMSTQLDVKGYNVYRSKSLMGTFYKLTKELVPFDTPFFKDSTIAEKKQYFFTITAVDSAGNESEQSNPISTYLKDEFPPEAPSNLTYKIVDGKVQLNWKPSKAKDLLGYHIYKSSRPTGMKSRITIKANVSNSYNDVGEEGKGYGYGAKFYYTLVAQDSSGNNSDSLDITVLVPDVEAPKPPIDFNLDNKGDYVFITCGMSPSLDASKYILSKTELGKKTQKLREYNKAPFQFIDTISTKGKSYCYSVSVIDTADNISETVVKDTVLFRDFSPPPAPRNVKARLTDGKVLLTWVESIDFDMVGYNIYRSDYPTGSYELLNKKNITNTTFTDNTGNEKNFYRVKSVDSSGNESQYDETIPVK
jgi:fibronectin type 3 domain-containing protein